jgi:hypothetical protein
MIKSPILSLPNGITVKAMYADGVTGSVLISLSDGRILRMDEISMLAWLTGDRIISAQVMDGFGNVSVSGTMGILYALHNRIIEINRAKEQIKWKTVTEAFSATTLDEVSGTFTSPVMWAGEDFGFWKGLYWEHDSPAGTEVSVHARVSGDPTSILSGQWYDMSPGAVESENFERESSSSSDTAHTTTSMFKSMDRFNTMGNYLQIRITLKTSSPTRTPVVSKITAYYESKFAVYFFTQKFIMEQGSNAKDIFVTGTYSMPQNTEIRFGVTPGNSVDWNDYTVVEPGRLSSMPPGTNDRFKMGIKLLSWDDSAFPSVDEFAVMLGADKDNLLNGGD